MEGKAADDMEIENLNMGGGTSSAVRWMCCCLPCLAAGAVWLVPELDVMPHVLAWACKACCACRPRVTACRCCPHIATPLSPPLTRCVPCLPHLEMAFARADAFAQEMGGGESKSKVHIRTQQRNGRKSITTVQGLDEDLDLKKICKAFKKVRQAPSCPAHAMHAVLGHCGWQELVFGCVVRRLRDVACLWLRVRVRAWQNFSCNGAVVKNKELGKVIQLQGDQRQKVFTFMKKCKICEEERMVVHGF